MIQLDDAKLAIKEFISETSFIDISKIKDESLIFREGLFDSMGFISMISFIEEKFGIQVKDTELVDENFESVNAIYGYLLKKMNGSKVI
jgi:acyl carrier protein